MPTREPIEHSLRHCDYFACHAGGGKCPFVANPKYAPQPTAQAEKTYTLKTYNLAPPTPSSAGEAGPENNSSVLRRADESLAPELEALEYTLLSRFLTAHTLLSEAEKNGSFDNHPGVIKDMVHEAAEYVLARPASSQLPTPADPKQLERIQELLEEIAALQKLSVAPKPAFAKLSLAHLLQEYRTFGGPEKYAAVEEYVGLLLNAQAKAADERFEAALGELSHPDWCDAVVGGECKCGIGKAKARWYEGGEHD